MEKYCGAVANKKNPNILTRAEVETLAVQNLQLKKSEIRKLSKQQLCKLLNIPLYPPIPSPSSINCVDRSDKTLKKHQKKVVEFMNKNHGLLVFHKVGSGKTLTAITVSQCYLDSHPQGHVVVITPAGLVNNFKDEMENSYVQLNHTDRYSYYSYQGFMTKSKKDLAVDCTNALLIIDEAHNLRTMNRTNSKGKEFGVMNKYITNCAKKADKVLLLTGTPLYNTTKDLVALYNMISPDQELVKPKSFDIQDMKCKISYRGATQQHFPKRKDIDVFLTMSPQYEAKYDLCIASIKNPSMKHKLIMDLYGDGDFEAFYNVIRRAVNNLEDKDSEKIRWIVDKIKTTPPDEKIIVFSHFLNAGIRVVMKELPKSIPYGVIEGSIPMKDRKALVEEFKKNQLRVLFISKAGGEGLDLKGVRHVIIMEPAWNQATEEQVIGRAIRYKSHEHLDPKDRIVNVYHLYHIRPSDSDKVEKLKKWFAKIRKGETDELPINPYQESFDIFMRYVIGYKQIGIDNFIQQLEDLSIEKNDC